MANVNCLVNNNKHEGNERWIADHHCNITGLLPIQNKNCSFTEDGLRSYWHFVFCNSLSRKIISLKRS